jgi:hypothetical protein
MRTILETSRTPDVPAAEAARSPTDLKWETAARSQRPRQLPLFVPGGGRDGTPGVTGVIELGLTVDGTNVD